VLEVPKLKFEFGRRNKSKKEPNLISGTRLAWNLLESKVGIKALSNPNAGEEGSKSREEEKKSSLFLDANK